MGTDPNGKRIEENTIVAIEVLLNSLTPEKIGSGLETFKIFHRLTTAFEDAKKTEILMLEETDYEFIKQIINENIPSSWGMNEDIYNAIDCFMNAEDYTTNKK